MKNKTILIIVGLLWTLSIACSSENQKPKVKLSGPLCKKWRMLTTTLVGAHVDADTLHRYDTVPSEKEIKEAHNFMSPLRIKFDSNGTYIAELSPGDTSNSKSGKWSYIDSNKKIVEIDSLTKKVDTIIVSILTNDTLKLNIVDGHGNKLYKTYIKSN